MTSVVTNLARQYRVRAEEARARAAVALTEEANKSLLQIAETWERMARYEEQHLPHRNQWRIMEREPAAPTPPKPYA